MLERIYWMPAALILAAAVLFGMATEASAAETRIDSDDVRVTYSTDSSSGVVVNQWARVATSSAYEGAHHRTTTTGAFAELKVNVPGTLTLYGSLNTGGGDCRVTVNGETKATCTSYGASQVWMHPLATVTVTKGAAAFGAVVRLVHTGNGSVCTTTCYTRFDAFDFDAQSDSVTYVAPNTQDVRVVNPQDLTATTATVANWPNRQDVRLMAANDAAWNTLNSVAAVGFGMTVLLLAALVIAQLRGHGG